MPIIETSSYKKKPALLLNAHFETIYPSAFRKVEGVNYNRERLELSDGDFLDIDWLKNGNDKVVIISHGLEGSANRPYVMGAAKLFSENGWDVLAWNYRSCSGEMNRNKRLYHHGVTDDYEAIVNKAIKDGYSKIGLVGFSMGGSTTLKFLGEQGEKVPEQILGASVFSVPCNLYNSVEMLLLRSNWFYKRRFIKKLVKKVIAKAEQYPEIDVTNAEQIDTFEELDDRFTAPLHGFENGMDFYRKSTSDQFYPNIKKPVLLVNALNDPMLGDKCYPIELAKEHEYLYLETPKHGGHVGFMVPGDEHTWSERRALEFMSQLV